LSVLVALEETTFVSAIGRSNCIAFVARSASATNYLTNGQSLLQDYPGHAAVARAGNQFERQRELIANVA